MGPPVRHDIVFVTDTIASRRRAALVLVSLIGAKCAAFLLRLVVVAQLLTQYARIIWESMPRQFLHDLAIKWRCPACQPREPCWLYQAPLRSQRAWPLRVRTVRSLWFAFYLPLCCHASLVARCSQTPRPCRKAMLVALEATARQDLQPRIRLSSAFGVSPHSKFGSTHASISARAPSLKSYLLGNPSRRIRADECPLLGVKRTSRFQKRHVCF
jgi:hypothetical protein